MEAPTHEDPVDEPVIEDEQAPPVVESLTPKDSVNADEQLEIWKIRRQKRLKKLFI